MGKNTVNLCILTGRLSSQVTLIIDQSTGKQCARFSLSMEFKGKSEIHYCKVYGEIIEKLKNLPLGEWIEVEGRLTYKDKYLGYIEIQENVSWIGKTQT